MFQLLSPENSQKVVCQHMQANHEFFHLSDGNFCQARVEVDWRAGTLGACIKNQNTFRMRAFNLNDVLSQDLMRVRTEHCELIFGIQGEGKIILTCWGEMREHRFYGRLAQVKS